MVSERPPLCVDVWILIWGGVECGETCERARGLLSVMARLRQSGEGAVKLA
jgi:hypothetical protein